MAQTTLDRIGPPDTRGICYSCDAVADYDIAVEVARSVGDAATWYSVGILNDDQDLAARFATFCTEYKLLPLFHPIDLDLCGTDPYDPRVLTGIRDRAAELGTPWVNADLAMWCRGGEALLDSLVPMPLVPESIRWAADRVKHAQDVLQVPITIENAPYPFIIGDEDILQLMTQIAKRADCLMTVDVGHLYGLRRQRHQSAVLASDADVDWDRVVEAHMSGTFVRHFGRDTVVVDDKHDWTVADEVWQLALDLLPRAGNLRAVMAEAEGMAAAELAASVHRFQKASTQWWQS